MTDTSVRPPLGWVVYDGDCGLCRGLMRRFQPLLGRRGFRFIPLQTPWARERLQITIDEPLTELKLLLADGHACGGADAVVEIARFIWWARPFLLFTSLPGGMTLMRSVYRRIAANRHCAPRSLNQRSAAFTPLHCPTGSADYAISNATAFCTFRRRNRRAPSSGVGKPARWMDWLPLMLLPAFAIIIRNMLPAWAFMWLLAWAILFGCKWLTWCRARRNGLRPTIARSLGYLVAWPGMDAMAFCARGGARTFLSSPQSRSGFHRDCSHSASSKRSAAPIVSRPTSHSYDAADRNVRAPGPAAVFRCARKLGTWSFAFAKTVAGALIIWAAARGTFVSPLLTGWLGMIGIVLFLHFGLFHLLALAWQTAGVNAQPIMRAPLLATSLAQFWGRRWNTAFNTLAHDLAFRPFVRRWGVTGATIAVFLISGLVHESVISLPARGGFGLPTAYFAAQSLGVLVERSSWGRRFGLGRGFRGWLFVLACAAAPAFWLFHPIFIRNIILPMLRAIGAN
jgi:predicted DCC family thiol-disulfide oxidoreductase YuxK